jgi:hypothetical protein
MPTKPLSNHNLLTLPEALLPEILFAADKQRRFVSLSERLIMPSGGKGGRRFRLRLKKRPSVLPDAHLERPNLATLLALFQAQQQRFRPR